MTLRRRLVELSYLSAQCSIPEHVVECWKCIGVGVVFTHCVAFPPSVDVADDRGTGKRGRQNTGAPERVTLGLLIYKIIHVIFQESNMPTQNFMPRAMRPPFRTRKSPDSNQARSQLVSLTTPSRSHPRKQASSRRYSTPRDT